MPFVKGKSGNPNGRKKDVPNKATTDQRERAALIIDNNIEKMQGWINEVAAENPERAYKMVLDMFEFSLPKLKAIDYGFGNSDVTINVTVKKNEHQL